MLKHPLIVHNEGSIIDHIGIGVPDFDAALQDMERKLGVRPLDLGTFGTQRRAAGWLGIHGFLEVLGPATGDAAALDPMMRLVATLPSPAVMFWYAATNDFDAYSDHAARAGYPLQGDQHIQRNGFDYQIAGPGGIAHVPVVPWMIQWITRPPEMDRWPQLGQLRRFDLEHPAPLAMQDIMSALGIPAPVNKGAVSRVLLSIDGPAGRFDMETAINLPGMPANGAQEARP